MTRPAPKISLTTQDIQEIIDNCEGYIDTCEKVGSDYAEDDIQYVFEATMRKLYGPDVFKYTNQF